MTTISLKEALDQMEKRDHKGRPVPFCIQFCTCDMNRKTGGELITMEKAILAKYEHNLPRHVTKNSTPGKPLKAANQWDNQTRNFTIPGTNQIRKGHIRLFTAFNGKPIRY